MVQTIFANFRRRLANTFFMLSERAGGANKRTNVKADIAVAPKSKFAIKAAILGSYLGLSRRNGLFYKCEYDLDEIKRAADTEGYLAVAIQKYSELFMKSGYCLKGEKDEAADYLRQRFRLMSYMSEDNVPFPLLMRETAFDLVKFSNAFWIKTRTDKLPFIRAKGIVSSGKCVAGYSRLDPAQVRIQFNEEGKICKYKQVTPTGKEKEFVPDDVIHFVLNRPAGSVWGVPRWITALEDIRFLRELEGNVATIAYRFSAPMIQAKVGLDKDGLYGTRKEIEETTQLIENTPPDGLLVTNERVNLSIIGAEGNALDLKPYLEHLENRVFTDLNTSQAMMGRGGSKQDADSMEEQVHNAVKDNQAAFAIQFEEKVITELLMEGGYNPILKEEDNINLVFNEINLDTRVKLENHVTNLYHANAITVDEMRTALGYRSEDIDKDKLYSNYIEQENTIEQIKLNHKNAVEIAKLSASLAQQSANDSDGGNNNEGQKAASKKQNYTKKNTGNGKNPKNGKASGAVKTTDSPSNQHGTYSAKIKEFALIDNLSESIRDDGRNLNDAKNRVLTYVGDMSSSGAKEGAKQALDEMDASQKHDLPPLAPQNSTLIRYFNKNIEEYFSDINNEASNTGDECGFKNLYESKKYRLNMLADFVYRKSYWYAYLKTCESHGVSRFKICCRGDSRHKDEHAGKIINARNFNINEIPGYSTGCHCYLEPLKDE